jgi:hypothetical protein
MIISDNYLGERVKEIELHKSFLGDLTVPIDYCTALSVIWPDISLNKLTYLMGVHPIFKSESGRLIKNIYEIQHSKERLISTNKRNRVCNSMWTTWSIRKKRGGLRYIAHPFPLLKKVLRQLGEWLDKVPLHECIHGFVKGQNIGLCVKPLMGCQAVWSTDITDAFPSVTQKKLYKLFKKWGLTNEVSHLFSELSTQYNRLTQGSPASPRLFNHILQEALLPILWDLERRGCILSIWADGVFVGFIEKTSAKEVDDVARLVTRQLEIQGFRTHKTRVNRPGQNNKQPFGLSIIDPEDLWKNPEWPSVTKGILTLGFNDIIQEVISYGIEEMANREGVSCQTFINRITGRFAAWKACGGFNSYKCEEYYDIWTTLVSNWKAYTDKEIRSWVTQSIMDTEINITMEDKKEFTDYYNKITELL